MDSNKLSYIFSDFTVVKWNCCTFIQGPVSQRSFNKLLVRPWSLSWFTLSWFELVQVTLSKFTLSYECSPLYQADINGAPILRFTMATADKKSSAYSSPVELEIRMHTYGEYEHIFRREKVTLQQHKGERLGMGEKCCLSKCRSLNEVLVTLIILQVKTESCCTESYFSYRISHRRKANLYVIVCDK